MNAIDQLFEQRGNCSLLSLYFCAGSPTVDGTASVLRAMEQQGVDMVEVGFPFSDPLADGPVIQQAATEALQQGMTLDILLEQLRAVKDELRLPRILMGYLNVVEHYGRERFIRHCVEAGVSGCIIPDLPLEEYVAQWKPLAEAAGLHFIMMVTPETSEERIRLIDEHTGGFIYLVSSASITGAQQRFDDARQAYFRRIASMGLRHPLMVGFGISNKQTLQAATQYAAGAIVGSAFVTLLRESENAETAVTRLKQQLSLTHP